MSMVKEANHSQKTSSKLRNVGGYLLNKLTKPKSTNKSTLIIPTKKRKNFFSLFDRCDSLRICKTLILNLLAFN